MSDTDSGSGGLLAGAVVFLVLGLMSIAMVVGAVVPPVGDFMGVDVRGIGGVLGYLFATAFFGGPGVVLLLSWRRARADRPAEDWATSARLAEQRLMPLPDGPGLAVRWLVAVPLMVLSVGLPYVGFAAVTAWSSQAFGAILAEFGDEPAPSFLSEFGENLQTSGQTFFLPLLVLVAFLLRRGRIAAWPTGVLWVTGWLFVPAIFIGSATSDAPLPDIAFAVGLVWLSWELARATVRVLSRPVALDIVGSALEIPYQLPGRRVRLRLQRDRLVLDRLTTSKDGTKRLVMKWSDVREAELIELREDLSWAAGPATIDVPAGPVLRIVSAKQKWLIPVPEYLGECLTSAITLRAARRRQTV